MATSLSFPSLVLWGTAWGMAIITGAVFTVSIASRAKGAVVRPAATALELPAPICADERIAATVSQTRALVHVPAGVYRPFFKAKEREVKVGEFLLEAEPVSEGAFLEFVSCHPKWRRSFVAGAHAEAPYLRHWRSDLDPGETPRTNPVAFVSWFAARAYCESVGRRLPTVPEWERALGTGAFAPTHRVSPSARDERFAFAMGHAAPDLEHTPLSAGGNWEWTEDFNASRASTGSGASQFCGDGVRSNDPSDYGAFLRYSFRSSLKAGYTLKNVGFRCAGDAR